MNCSDRPRHWGSLMTGIILLGLGVFFLLFELNVVRGTVFISGWWALLITTVGLLNLVRARRAKDAGEGVTLTLIGVWLYLAHTGSFGFSYASTWPLVLVAVGAGMLARTALGHWLPDQRVRSREGRHE